MIVVTDTSVVLNLTRIGRANLLADLFATVFAPRSVRVEFERLALADPRFRSLVFPDFIHTVAPAAIIPALACDKKLDAGEIDALSLALELGADAVLMDEKAGRNAAANFGLPHVGILGILVESKRKGLVPEILPLMDQLLEDAGFWLAPALKRRVLGVAGE